MFASATLLALLGSATAHMQVQFPPPLKSKFNPNTPSAEIDYEMTDPLEASGANFPCKGYQSLLGSPAGAPTASFAIGSKANMTITGSTPDGSANHGGGSCQISLSTDGAKTFTVLQSIVGNCPAAGTSQLDFTIPADAPAGDHVLAWTWHNQIGNREMYMNCAAVTLTTTTGGGAKRKMAARAAAYASRPGIFIANVGPAGGGCTTEETFDVLYPEPGPDVTNESTKPKAPTCGVTQQVGGSGGGGGDGASGAGSAAGAASSSSSSASLASSPTPPAQPATTFVTSAKPSAAAATSTTGPSVSSSSVSSAAASAPTIAGSGTTSTPNPPGSACADEGAWACLSGGASFQRCASGQWSVVMATAPGTTCTGGTSDQINMVAVGT